MNGFKDPEKWTRRDYKRYARKLKREQKDYED